MDEGSFGDAELASGAEMGCSGGGMEWVSGTVVALSTSLTADVKGDQKKNDCGC
jgi:hypothetical protein